MKILNVMRFILLAVILLGFACSTNKDLNYNFEKNKAEKLLISEDYDSAFEIYHNLYFHFKSLHPTDFYNYYLSSKVLENSKSVEIRNEIASKCNSLFKNSFVREKVMNGDSILIENTNKKNTNYLIDIYINDQCYYGKDIFYCSKAKFISADEYDLVVENVNQLTKIDLPKLIDQDFSATFFDPIYYIPLLHAYNKKIISKDTFILEQMNKGVFDIEFGAYLLDKNSGRFGMNIFKIYNDKIYIQKLSKEEESDINAERIKIGLEPIQLVLKKLCFDKCRNVHGFVFDSVSLIDKGLSDDEDIIQKLVQYQNLDLHECTCQ